MVKKLINVDTKLMNWFPAKVGVSPYYSPHFIMHGLTLDYKKDYQIPFGAYVQVSY